MLAIYLSGMRNSRKKGFSNMDCAIITSKKPIDEIKTTLIFASPTKGKMARVRSF